MRGLGRINRATYWAMVAAIFVISIAVQFLLHPEFNITGLLLVFVGVARLHDIGKSGWWALGVLALEVVAGIAMGKLVPAAQLMPAIAVTTVVVLALIAWAGIVRGQVGANRFGAEPATGLSYAPEPDRNA